LLKGSAQRRQSGEKEKGEKRQIQTAELGPKPREKTWVTKQKKSIRKTIRGQQNSRVARNLFLNKEKRSKKEKYLGEDALLEERRGAATRQR